MAITAETRNDIIELVVVALNEAPGTTLLNELVAIVDAGGSLADVADALTSSDSWKAKYPAFQTAEEFADEWLGNLVPEASAAALAEGKSVAVGLVNGGASFSDIIIAAQSFLSATAESDAAFGTSVANFNNKTEVATYYTITQEVAAAGTDTLSDVDSSEASVTAAKAAVDTAVAPAGSTIALTTGLDTGASFTGGATDDTFSAQETGTATTDTLTTGDNLKGGAGTDTLSIAVSGTPAGGITSGVVTSGIEAITVYNNSTAAYEVDAALMSGISDVYINGGANATTVDDVDSLANMHLISTNVNAELSPAAGVATGTADAAVILSNGAAQVASMTATYDGVEVINFIAAGTTGLKTSTADRSLTLASNELEKVVVTGDADANLTVNLVGAALDTQTSEFDASAASGKITAHVTVGASENAAVTLSAQDDYLDFNGAISRTYTLDGGEGTDYLQLDNDLTYSKAAATAGLAQAGDGISNFEALRLESGVDVDETAMPNNAGITAIVAEAGGSYDEATALASITQLSSGTFTTTLATDGTSDALSLTVAGAAAVASVLDAEDVESLTVTSAGLAANSVTMDDEQSADLTSITAAGTKGLTLNIGGAALATVDASGITGTGSLFALDASDSEVDMTVTHSSARPTNITADAANTITTGEGDDTLTGGDYIDVLDGGAGDDTITGGDGDNTLTGGAGDDTITGGADDDTINDGAGDDTVTAGAGDDTINLGAGSDTVDAGAGDDTIAAGTNLSSGDDIDGGAGDEDALTATISGVGIAPTIAGVESISLGFGASTYVDMENVTGSTALVVDSATAGGAAARIKNLASGVTITLTDEATLAGTGDITTLTVDTAADATVGVKIAANDAAATPAATAITGLTFTDAKTVNITNEGGSVDNVLDHQIAGNLVLDDDETNGLSLTTSAYGTLDFGANVVTNTSELTSFSATSAAYGDITLDTIADAEALQSLTISASGTSSDIAIGAIGGGTASTAMTDISLSASAGGQVDTGAITAAANLSTVTISADGNNSDVTPGGAFVTGNGGISSVSISASGRGNVDMTSGDLTVGSGLVSGLAVSASGRGTVDLAGFTADSTATGTAGTYSITTSDRGSITMSAATSISTDGSLTKLTVAVGEDSTLNATDGLITAAGTITDTVISTGIDAVTSGNLTIGEATTVHTDAIVTLDADATNGADIDLLGATFTKLTVTLGGSDNITIGTVDVDADLVDTANVMRFGYDTNAEALEVGVGLDDVADPTITAVVVNASGNSGTNSIDVSLAAKATVTGGSGADTITGTAGKDTLSGGAGDDIIDGGAGADAISVGTGSDTVTSTIAESVAATAVFDASTDAAIAAAAVLAASDTITFGSGVDVITGFQAGALASGGDRLDTASGTLPTTAVGLAHDDLADGADAFFLSGAFNSTTGVFTIAADGTGADTMVIEATAALDAIDDSTSIVILVGVDSDDLIAANFI